MHTDTYQIVCAHMHTHIHTLVVYLIPIYSHLILLECTQIHTYLCALHKRKVSVLNKVCAFSKVSA